MAQQSVYGISIPTAMGTTMEVEVHVDTPGARAFVVDERGEEVRPPEPLLNVARSFLFNWFLDRERPAGPGEAVQFTLPAGWSSAGWIDAFASLATATLEERQKEIA